MFLSPEKAVEEGWIVFPKEMPVVSKQKCMQPNAIDFTIDRLFTVAEGNPFILSEEERTMRGGAEVATTKTNEKGQAFWHLFPHTVYDGLSNFYVSIPKGVAAILYPRSSLVRNGLYLAAGLHDSLYQNNLGFVLHNHSGDAYVAPGTRVGQIAFVSSDSVGGYSGVYNNEKGKHWLEAIKAQ